MTLAPERLWTAPAVTRQPLRDDHGRVVGYAVEALTPTSREDDEAQVERAYAELDLGLLSAGLPVVVRATRSLLDEWELDATSGVCLGVPGSVIGRPETATRIEQLHGLGVPVSLAEYRGTAEQNALLPWVAQVAVDAHDDVARLQALVAHAHNAGLQVVARGADTVRATDTAFTCGVDLVQGPLVVRGRSDAAGSLDAAELQCLELLRLLAEDPVDQGAVIGLVAVEPALAVSVLRLVNSAAMGRSRVVDSVRQAVVLVGPRRLHALTVGALMAAGDTTVHELWAVLARATSVWDLTEHDAGYTVGMLSAVAGLRRLPPDVLAERAGLSDEAKAALCTGEGSLGGALRAVVSHEEGDASGVLAAGWDPAEVAEAWLATLPETLALACALTD